MAVTLLLANLAAAKWFVREARTARCDLTLRDILPSDPDQYDKSFPPKKGGRPTVVQFHVTVMSLDSIDEESMVDWLKRMWRPDCVFKNAKQVTFQTMTVPNHYIWLYQDKTIFYMVKLTLTLSCAMNFASYPHDTQICSMQMESLSHTTDDLVFQWNDADPLVVHKDFELPQLDLEKTDLQDCTELYSTGNFTCLQLTFTLKRRLGYYMFHTYIPTCLIVIMSWVSFWIKPEAVPARVTLGVTSLLTLCTQHAKSQASLPPVSYIKAIDIFMSSCTVFVFASLMEYAVVNIILEDGDKVEDKCER
ncbi:hypothetical protein HPB47_000284, partial [Ixodes persulcatus]